MDTDNKQTVIAIELRHANPMLQHYFFEKFRKLEKLFQQMMGKPWHWELHTIDEDGKQVSRISAIIKGVNVLIHQTGL